MEIGDTVEWPTRRGRRRGQIIRFVEPGEDVRKMLPPITPGHPEASLSMRLRTPCWVHCKSRVLIRVWLWRDGWHGYLTGQDWTYGLRGAKYDYIYYCPTCDWFVKVFQLLEEAA